MKMKKTLAMLLAGILTTMSLAGCGGKKAADGVTEFTIGNAPTSAQASYDNYMKKVDEFNAAHPEYKMLTSDYTYDTKNFAAKAAGGTLPTTYVSHFTEIGMISQNGYCADIAPYMEELGLIESYNPDILNVVRGENGEIWGLPHEAYCQGLTVNKKLFKEAGLVNDDGTVKFPKSWDELSEFAKQIKDKTGQAGFVIPTTDNCGGWHFINVAWSYGTKFMEQDKDGKWKATFNSPEFKKACEWLYDLRWNKDAVYTDKTAIAVADIAQIFGANQAGMMLYNPPTSVLTNTYGMTPKDIACGRLPEGPAGRYAQSGGSVVFFNADATPEQIRGALKWYIEKGGWNTEVTDETLARSEEGLKNSIEQKDIILDRPEAFPKFIEYEGRDKELELQKKYMNIEPKDYDDYFSFEDVKVTPEEPVCCQELYAVMDGIIQEIMTNQNVNLDELIKTAVNDFQSNHLDNL